MYEELRVRFHHCGFRVTPATGENREFPVESDPSRRGIWVMRFYPDDHSRAQDPQSNMNLFHGFKKNRTGLFA